jgi:uncharacterized protein (TIGR03437 family)
MVVFGGSGATLFNDTWEFDPASNRWSRLEPLNVPAARLRHQGVFAPSLQSIYFFGGNTDRGKSDELIRLAAARPPLVNAFSQQPESLAPGGLVTLYGDGLGPENGVAASGVLPATLAGVSVTVGGYAAAMLYAQAKQINFQVPYEAPLGVAQMIVRVDGRTKDPATVQVQETAPGIFPRAFRSGDVMTVYVTGVGRVAPSQTTGELASAAGVRPLAAIEVELDGKPAEILYSGLTAGTAGVLQLNLRAPTGITNPLPVRVRAGGREIKTELNVE